MACTSDTADVCLKIDSTIYVCGVNLIESISTPVKVKNIIDQVGLSV